MYIFFIYIFFFNSSIEKINESKEIIKKKQKKIKIFIASFITLGIIGYLFNILFIKKTIKFLSFIFFILFLIAMFHYYS